MRKIILYACIAILPLNCAYATQPHARIDAEFGNKGGNPAVITFTFDDGQVNTFVSAFPELSKYGYPATAYITTSGIGISQWYMNWDQVALLAQHGWEIAAHTHTHPHLISLPLKEAEYEITESVRILREKGYNPTSFAFPHEEIDERMTGIILREGFSNYRDELNAIPNNNNIRVIKFNKPIFNEVKNVVDEAIRKGTWLIFIFHAIVSEPREHEFPIEVFNELLAYIHEKKIRVVTLSNQLNSQIP